MSSNECQTANEVKLLLPGRHIKRPPTTHACQTFISVRANVCARKDRQQNPHEPPPYSNSLSLSISLCLSLSSYFSLFPVSIILSFPHHLSVLASQSRCHPPRRSSSRWRGAALDLCQDTNATIMSSSIKHESYIFFKLNLFCVHAVLYVCRWGGLILACPILFPPCLSSAWLLRGGRDKVSSQFRRELGLIGRAPPTVPTCVCFSVALLWAHGNIGS